LKARNRFADFLFWAAIIVLIYLLAMFSFYLHGKYIKSDAPMKYIRGRSDTTIVIRENFYHETELQPISVSAPDGDSARICDDSLRVYFQTYVDSNSTTEVRDSVRGLLLSREVKTKANQIFVTRVDTLKMTSTIEKNFKRFAAFGILIQSDDLNDRFGAGVSLNYNTRKNASILLQRDFINKRTAVGVGVRF
jgi:hypothetical protein